MFESATYIEAMISRERPLIRANFNLLVADKCLKTLATMPYKSNDLDNLIDAFALFSAFVVAYGKLYVSGSAQETSLLNVDLFKGDPKGREAHDLIMSFRHKVCAHDDEHPMIVAGVETQVAQTEIRIVHNMRLELPFGELKNFSHALEVSKRALAKRADKILSELERRSGKKAILQDRD
jgi:hypothetical protein